MIKKCSKSKKKSMCFFCLPKNLVYGKSVELINKLEQKNAIQPLEKYPDITLVPPINIKYRMKRDGSNCGSCALYLFNGKESNINLMTIHQLHKKTKSHMYENFNLPALYCGYFLNFSDRRTTALLFVCDPNGYVPDILPTVFFQKKLLIVIYEDYSYPKGHCIVILPPNSNYPDIWALQDPFLLDGKAIAINQQQIVLILASASFVFY